MDQSVCDRGQSLESLVHAVLCCKNAVYIPMLYPKLLVYRLMYLSDQR